MKVLVATGLYPPEIGGPATYSRLLEGRLPSHGISTYILPYSRVRKYPNAIRQIVYAYLVWRHSRGCDALYAQDTASVGWPTYFANLFLWKRFVVRVPGDHAWEQGVQRFKVTEQLDSFPLWSWGWHPWLMLIRLFQLIVVRHADRVVVPSKYIAHIVEHWGVERARIVVIYNGVDIGDVGVREVIRGLLHFDGKLIVSVGRLVPWKGFDDLIKLVPKLRKKFPDLKLLIIGNGPDLLRLEQLAEESGATDHVIFAGSVEHQVLMRYLRASDMLVLNSSYEGLSHLVLEAMAVGIPVITTKVGGNPEVIDDGVNGYLVRARDQKAIESKITSLFSDGTLYKKLVDGGFRKVSQFTHARVAEENALLFKTLCAS